MRVVFCDYDGVISTRESGFQEPNPTSVAALNDLMALTEGSLVITSVRRQEGVSDTVGLYRRAGITGRIIGATPILPDGPAAPGSCLLIPRERGDEVTAWMESCPFPITSYVVLDDNPIGALHGSRFIRIDESRGMTYADVTRAQKILGVHTPLIPTP